MALLALLLIVVGCSVSSDKEPAPAPPAPASAEDARPLKAGDAVPKVTLTTVDGRPFDLRKAVAKKPTALIFYRGGWCPFCTRQLSGLRKIAPELRRLGYQILAVSPDRPKHLRESITKVGLDYRLLSDSDMAAARAFGLAFQVDAATLKKYEGYGIDLEEASGQSHHLLPIPAVFLVNTDGGIRFAFANPDYKVRLKPEALLSAAAGVTSEDVTFRSGGDSVGGYLARPLGKGPFPTILLIHEWWGLEAWVKQNADRFARKGYVALAVDLYRGKSTTDPKVARKLKGSVPAERAVRDMKAALSYLRTRPFVRADRVGAIGWCMGGGYALKLATEAKVDACVICYGRLVTDSAKIRRIAGPVLGIFGDRDRAIPVGAIHTFGMALAGAGVPHKILIYPGGRHAFMNARNPERHHAEATRKAWQEIDAFFSRTLKKSVSEDQ